MTDEANPLLSDRDVDFLLYEVHDAAALCALPYFTDHSRETFALVLDNTRRLARAALAPAYRAMDAEPPMFERGHVRVHPRMHALYPRLVELGVIAAPRPYAVGGQQLPLTVFYAMHAYLSAANLAASGLPFLTTGAAHLLEAFGNAFVHEQFMAPMYRGEWTGTMALTEPHAGSSLADVTTQAVASADGSYRLRGTKIFISGGDQDVTPNIVHMVLARLSGAPPGIKGVSLFAVPKLRRDSAGALRPNDVQTAGLIHKIGWRGLPSVALNLGEQDDCHGWLVGEPHRGIAYMFQMMNEARLSVGVSAAATASVAYQSALAYARERPQGRLAGTRDPASPQVPIIAHADVRRMLLRQKAIVEGALALVLATARYADLAAHSEDAAERARAALLLDLLTPVAKSFPAEKGFESNALAVQVHGGYGYSSEYLPEAYLRDQKLNSLHEGTTGIQSLDLLGRKAIAGGGAALVALGEELAACRARAGSAGVSAAWGDALGAAYDAVCALTMELGGRGAAGDVEAMLRHSADYLELFSVLLIAWQWLAQAAAASAGLRTVRTDADSDFYQGKLCAAQYWFATELPRAEALVALCRSNDDAYARMQPGWF